MHEIDLSNYNVRTDMIIDKNINPNNNKKIEIIENIYRNDCYISIKFKDITDKNNYKKVLDKLIIGLKKMLKHENIKKSDACLIIGLGNINSTPDSLGPKTLEKILVTRHLFNLGDIEKGYRNVSILTPSVTGITGIETKDTILGVIKKVKPEFLIIIDSLASSKIDHLNKVIQISNTAITPGSGIGNKRDSLSKKSLNIPIIVIGVPTVVDEVTIVYDTIKYMNIDISKEQINNTLLPINYNLIVTPKDIDYQIEKLSNLVAEAINNVLHDAYDSTKK